MATLATLLPPTPSATPESVMTEQSAHHQENSASDRFQFPNDKDSSPQQHQPAEAEEEEAALASSANSNHEASSSYSCNEALNADTITASNVSNLRLQLAATTAGHQHPSNYNENSFNSNNLTNQQPRSASNLSLRDMFTDPKYEEAPVGVADGSSVHQNDSFGSGRHSKEELWEYDGGSSLEEEEGSHEPPSSRRINLGGMATPPDSLHHRKRPEPSSSLVRLQRDEGSKRYHAPPPTTVSDNDANQAVTTDPPLLLQQQHDSSEDSSSSSSSFRQRSYSPGEPHTVLYSAIGSLEDPSNSSFKWSKQRNQVPKYAVPKKFEMPKGLLLAPLSALQQQKSGTGVSSTTATTGAITVLEPQPTIIKSEDASSSSKRNEEGAVDQPKTEDGGEDGNAQVEETTRPSNLRKKAADASSSSSAETGPAKKVQISDQKSSSKSGSGGNNKRKAKKKIEMFRPSSDAYTPRMGKREIKYKPAEQRTPVVSKMTSGLGSLSRPNFRDALRRVAMIIQQHIVKIERRFEAASSTVSTSAATNNKKRGYKVKSDKLFMASMKEEFQEDRYVTPTYKCTMVRVPMARAGMVYGLKQIRHQYEIPSEREIYDFAHRLFKTVQLSSECSIVCLIYVERLMEEGKVPLLASTWRPIFLTGLLLASKVWQDLSSWNIEFTNVYPQFSLQAIAQLEVKFLRILKWDLYIKSSQYAKYYFALRSLVEKQDFRQRYYRMVGGVDNVQPQDALKVEERSGMMKEEALMQLSRSM